MRDILNLPQWNSMILPGWRIYYHPEAFRSRVWISLLLTVPVFIFSPYMPAWLNLHPPVIPGIHYISFILGLLIYVYGGMVFIQGAYYELRHIQPGMMTLSALSISLLMAYSSTVTFGLPGMEIYLEMAVLTVLMLLGHWLCSRLMLSSGQMLEKRSARNPEMALAVTGDGPAEMPVSSLQPGQQVVIRPGAIVPMDGRILEGASLVNESLITGSSRAEIRQPGDIVLAGSLNGEEELLAATLRSGPDTVLAASTRHIFDLQNQPDSGQLMAVRAAYWLVVAAIIAASFTAIYWAWQGQELVFIIERVSAVLVAVSPPAISLAIPMVFLAASMDSIEQGVLVVQRPRFAEARRISYVIFGKTGILSRGQMQLHSLHNLCRLDDDQLLQWAASLESGSVHPAARALSEAARLREIAVLPAEEVHTTEGVGIRGVVAGRTITLGGAAILSGQNILPSVERRNAEREASLAGLSIVYMMVEDQLCAIFGLADLVREDAGRALQGLHRMGIRTAIISGDSEAVTQRIASQLDVINYAAGLSPAGKKRHIQGVQQREEMVAVVAHAGTGAPLLAQSDIGIGMGIAPVVAESPAALLLLKGEPSQVPRIIQMARTGHRRIMQNLTGAIIYNVLAIPLAAGLLSGLGLLPPLFLLPLMMFASILLVVYNARRLPAAD